VNLKLKILALIITNKPVLLTDFLKITSTKSLLMRKSLLKLNSAMRLHSPMIDSQTVRDKPQFCYLKASCVAFELFHN